MDQNDRNNLCIVDALEEAIKEDTKDLTSDESITNNNNGGGGGKVNNGLKKGFKEQLEVSKQLTTASS